MEGPYRDLGAGFARLTGVEGARRSPSRVVCVEDALLELLRNARDAGASRVYVATSLRGRRYRTVCVLDDGAGIPEAYRELIFEPGVTSRHLGPVLESSPAREARREARAPAAHGAGLSLYHIRSAALDARVLSPASPTAICATFDTRVLPERALQTLARDPSRPSKTNILATVQHFARANPHLLLYTGPPPRILATLCSHRIIQPPPLSPPRSTKELERRARELGLRMSLRTVQRILRGEIGPAGRVGGDDGGPRARRSGAGRGKEHDEGGPVLRLGEEERAGIAAILERAARALYLEVENLEVESRAGEVVVRARVYEPEEEYE